MISLTSGSSRRSSSRWLFDHDGVPRVPDAIRGIEYRKQRQNWGARISG
jgi:hypothetical protein